MKQLRGVLYTTAAIWGLKGLGLALFPKTLLVGFAGLPRYPEYVWVRSTGVIAIGFALVMVLVAQSVEENWWWTWAFILVQANLAILFLLKALFVANGHAPVWWVATAFATAVTGLLLWGIGRAYHQRPTGT